MCMRDNVKLHFCVCKMDQPAKPYMFASLTRPHSEQLLQGLQLLRQDHELCDIVLRVGDAKIHAHKVVLASISPYFKAMFTGNLSEKETSEVEFQCVDEAALKVMSLCLIKHSHHTNYFRCLQVPFYLKREVFCVDTLSLN